MRSTYLAAGIVIAIAIGAVAAKLSMSVMSPAMALAADEARLTAERPTNDPVLDKPAPKLEGISGWQNSKEIKLADLRGKVVVLHFWTFGCVNCQHNLPIYNAWQRDFAAKGVQIIGVHTPETDAEQEAGNVAEQMKKRGIEYPVAIDGEKKTWNAFANRYWPTIYLIDKHGIVRVRWEGELEINDAHGDKIMREKIEQLLAQK